MNDFIEDGMVRLVCGKSLQFSVMYKIRHLHLTSKSNEADERWFDFKVVFNVFIKRQLPYAAMVGL